MNYNEKGIRDMCKSTKTFFIPKLTKDVNDLPAAGPGGSCYVANTLGLLDNLDFAGTKERDVMEKFVGGWKKQERAYIKRLDEEVATLVNSSKKDLKFMDGMIWEEYANLIGTREMLMRLREELDQFAPEKAKKLTETLKKLGNELKEKTVPAPKEFIVSDAPWYDNRWPIYEIDEYKKRKAKEVN